MADALNQTPPFVDVNLYDTDAVLRASVLAFGGASATADLSAYGARLGAADTLSLAIEANRNPPRLERFDAQGFPREEVAFHPAYHALMTMSAEAGLHNLTWTEEGRPADAPAEVIRAAKFFMAAQIESAHLCPLTMTRASVAALASEPDLRARLMPKISARQYDPRFIPWWEKFAMTLGMGMTERQGGTDVRTNMTRATRAGEAFRIDGDKWFMSAPMCDAFLVLAQADEGLSCFLMPRFRADGSLNGLHFQRLKDKLGNHANASSEVVFENAEAYAVGPQGRGIATIIQMVQMTRLDCAISSAGLMRIGLAQALHHARHRIVFQKHLVDQPMMRNVLADMALTVAGAAALVMRLAHAFDHAAQDEGEAAYMRLMTPVAKYWICKTAPALLYEAMECLGGNGYVEDGPLARLYRETPVNAIWEGSGNVMCLDVLRALSREGEAAQAVIDSLQQETRDMAEAQTALEAVRQSFAAPDAEADARNAVALLAKLAAAAALAHAAPHLAAAFARAQLAPRVSGLFGSAKIPPDMAAALLANALP